MRFKDHFSGHAAAYAQHRPHYPQALFAWLAGQLDTHRLAWDCATGNGQAARALTRWFESVEATDASAQQIAEAPSLPGVRFRVAAAQASGLADRSVDLITVAQALHWFDRPAFYSEAQRVLRPGGVLAVWCYAQGYFEQAGLQAVFDHFYNHTVGADWPPERELIDQAYRSIDFPFAELEPPVMRMSVAWTLDQLLAYLGTWSATQRCRQRSGTDPLPALRDALSEHWGDAQQTRAFHWPIHMRVGRTPT